MTDLRHLRLDELTLDAVTAADVPALHAIYSDPRVWEHYPSLRHTATEQTADMVRSWTGAWAQEGLGPWVVRTAEGGDAILGHCGCMLRGGGRFWNLGYRLTPHAQGRGIATRVGARAIAEATALRPDVPVVAYLLQSNPASRRVAERLGLTEQHRGPDEGNPDREAVRLVLADRPLTADQLAAARS